MGKLSIHWISFQGDKGGSLTAYWNSSFKGVNGYPFFAAIVQPYYINYNLAVDVTVNYVDENGHTIASSVSLSGNIAQAYSTEQKAIAGYTFKAVQGNPTGTFSDQAQTVTYVYSKDPIKQSKLDSFEKPSDSKKTYKPAEP
ncbi:MucBP domain-containing protein [Lactiplantibacillus plantarum]|uniref:MucBP domain-containing protein n=1 Tax=Lactiplantibacillus plantarum TaxID=1590 RepID=UPI0030EEBEA3